MRINFNSIKPIYVQIADGIKDDIIDGKLKEGDLCYSQLQIAKELNVNPATAAKGINLLVAENIVQKQRGLSMIVSEGANDRIRQKRRDETFTALVEELINEAKKIDLSRGDVLQIISNYYSMHERDGEND